MVRRCASFVLGLALFGALGLAIAHAQPVKASGGSTGLSTPCGLPPAALAATSEWNLVSTPDFNFAAATTTETGGFARTRRIVLLSRVSWPSAVDAFPPLLHRPPPDGF